MSGPILQLKGHAKDLGGGFTVRRLLPAVQRQAVGPFLFFDHFGPVTVVPGDSHDVRPHPHIGLATVTYLFSGAIMHRDSLGYVQQIEPGAINWMTAGRGIVHSERRPESLADTAYVNHGIQLWAALPTAHEEAEPSFVHTPAATIPEVRVGDATVRVLIGTAFGQTSPVATYSPTLYLDVQLPGGATLEIPALAQEMAVYTVDNPVQLDGEALGAQLLAVVEPGQGMRLSVPGEAAARLMVIGGDALDAPRHMWWNFVSSRKERIVQAADDWDAQALGQVPGEVEWIPLPERRFIK
ncbi:MULTISPECIES: pirin family protein [unclassified Acidovorax]|uniref:pirin family protein n=1 Tax=unclassified Acidovorax TaxID=2684926 RepID=UPI001C4376BE|nr:MULTISPECIES: pirin family protein [unclassified Acidovorax]MBV7426847.1 pirin family protein [Acidovorax sp. sif0732]MBV7447972.1 pirin family protein [Acidovorax sp. sif0715]